MACSHRWTQILAGGVSCDNGQANKKAPFCRVWPLARKSLVLTLDSGDACIVTAGIEAVRPQDKKCVSVALFCIPYQQVDHFIYQGPPPYGSTHQVGEGLTPSEARFRYYFRNCSNLKRQHGAYAHNELHQWPIQGFSCQRISDLSSVLSGIALCR